jgi:hypothetical protein
MQRTQIQTGPVVILEHVAGALKAWHFNALPILH